MKTKKSDVAKAKELAAAWAENEQHMGEQAAYLVSCDELGIDPDDGYELLALIADVPE